MGPVSDSMGFLDLTRSRLAEPFILQIICWSLAQTRTLRSLVYRQASFLFKLRLSSTKAGDDHEDDRLPCTSSLSLSHMQSQTTNAKV